MQPDKKYLEKKSAQTGFAKDNLEKVWRLTVLLKRITESSALKNKFLLRGGTALNFIHSDIPRLSIDIDLDFIGALDKTGMESQKPGLIEEINHLAASLNYNIVPPELGYAAYQLILKYLNLGGSNARIKIDINWLNRLPMGITNLQFKTLFPESIPTFPVATLQTEELLAGKTIAFLDRLEPRDFYDVCQIAQGVFKCDLNLLRKLVIWTGCTRTEQGDFRKLTKFTGVSMTEGEFKNAILPLLSRNKTKPDFFSAKKAVETFIRNILKFTDNEKNFIADFYKKDVKPEVLFEQYPYPSEILKHPGLLWRQKNMK